MGREQTGKCKVGECRGVRAERGYGRAGGRAVIGRSGRIGDPAAPAFVGHVVTPFPGVDASVVAVHEKGWGCASGEGKRLMANADPTDAN